MKCEYSMDNDYVEVIYTDGSMLKHRCSKVEERLNINTVTESMIQKLLDENPIEYVAIALSGELEEYNIVDYSVRD